MKKIIRITTVASSLGKLLEGQLRFMDQHYEVVGISNDAEALVKIGEREGIRTIPLGLTRSITPLKDLRALYALYKILKRERPFIVHTHTPKAGTIGMMAAKLAGVPHRLHTVAGLPLLEATGIMRGILNTVERITYSCATAVYPNSQGLASIIVNNGLSSKKKIKVLANGSSNGIDTAHFDPDQVSDAERISLREKIGLTDDHLVFLFVGRIVRDKGIEELIQAFADLQKKHKNIKLLLLGTFEKALDPLSEAAESEINTNHDIHTLGWQTDVRPYFAISDLLVFPSYREGFPNVVMQAGAMGVASIVSDINGCNELVADGENGLVIPVKDSLALRKAMEHLILNPAIRQEMAGKSRSMIVSRYEQRLVWDAILREYRALEEL